MNSRNLTAIVSVILALLMIGCSSDNNSTKIDLLEGKWIILSEEVKIEEENNPQPSNQEDNSSNEEGSEQGEDQNSDQDENGDENNSQPAEYKTIDYDIRTEPKHYIQFDKGKYIRFTNSEENIIHEGRYAIKKESVTIQFNNGENRWDADFIITGNRDRLELVYTHEAYPHIRRQRLEKIDPNTPPPPTIPNFEEMHDATKPEGSYSNPQILTIDTKTESPDAFFSVDSVKQNRYHLYFMGERNEEYTISINDVNIDYDDQILDALKHLQVWITDVYTGGPFQPKQQFRIREGRDSGEINFRTQTGYIYIKLFTYFYESEDSTIEFNIKVKKKED